MKKYQVLVINSLFKAENMVIIKSEGTEIITRTAENVTPDNLHDLIYDKDIPIEDCEITVIHKDWRGNTVIGEY